jgi:hypothetical protein
MNKKITLVLASTAVAGGIALGASAIPAMASTTSPTPSASSSTDSSKPSVGGGTSADRAADVESRIASDLAGLVSDGTLTQEQADKVASTLAAKMPDGGRGGDHGGRGGDHGGRGGLGGLSTAATAIGVTEDELRTQLQAGKSVADVATANGVSEQTVIDAIVAEAQTHFADEVASGEHTQAEVDAKLADLSARVKTMVETAGLPQRGGHGPDGDGGPGTLTPNTTTSSSATASSAA